MVIDSILLLNFYISSKTLQSQDTFYDLIKEICKKSPVEKEIIKQSLPEIGDDYMVLFKLLLIIMNKENIEIIEPYIEIAFSQLENSELLLTSLFLILSYAYIINSVDFLTDHIPILKNAFISICS